MQASNFKTKSTEKTKFGANVPQKRAKAVPIFQFKRSKITVRVVYFYTDASALV